MPKRGGAPRALAKVAKLPRAIVAAGERAAWLARDDKNKDSIQTHVDGKVRTIYPADGSLVALTMMQEGVFFVEVAADASWRIGAVSLDGGTPTFTKPRSGRPPSMLAAKDEIFYYDGPERGVLRLSPDLSREEAVAERFICSPIAVSDRVFCAQVGGLFELPLDGHAPRALAQNVVGTVATFAANGTSLVWVEDSGKSGEDKLSLRTLSLTKLGDEPQP
jgi:hypothetical protein